jgi:arylsulfatase A-like enzyme
MILDGKFSVLCLTQKPCFNPCFIVRGEVEWQSDASEIAGGARVSTPRMDSLRRRGVTMRRHYVLPVCAPTRSALLTGVLPVRFGWSGAGPEPWATHGVALAHTLFPETLALHANYQTNLIGKWHLGHYEPRFWPSRRGFQHTYGYVHGGFGHFSHCVAGAVDWSRNEVTLVEKGHATTLIADEAIRRINTATSGQPEELWTKSPVLLHVAFRLSFTHFLQKMGRLLLATHLSH